MEKDTGTHTLNKDPNGRGRLSIVDLLVLSSFDQLLLIMKRRSTILSLLFHLVFPDLTLA
jgi:hypothetical protein